MENEVFFYDPYELKVPLLINVDSHLPVPLDYPAGQKVWHKGKPYIVNKVTIEDNMYFIYLKEII